jgi:hypothetical protein
MLKQLKHIHFFLRRSLKGGCEGIGQQGQCLDFGNSVTRSMTALTAIPRGAKFVTASVGILQL